MIYIYIYIYLLYDEREFGQLKHSIYLIYQYLQYLPTSFTRRVPQGRKIYSRVISDFEWFGNRIFDAKYNYHGYASGAYSGAKDVIIHCLVLYLNHLDRVCIYVCISMYMWYVIYIYIYLYTYAINIVYWNTKTSHIY